MITLPYFYGKANYQLIYKDFPDDWTLPKLLTKEDAIAFCNNLEVIAIKLTPLETEEFLFIPELKLKTSEIKLLLIDSKNIVIKKSVNPRDN